MSASTRTNVGFPGAVKYSATRPGSGSWKNKTRATRRAFIALTIRLGPDLWYKELTFNEETMSGKLRVALMGLGVMGTRVATALLGKKSFEIVGAIDVNPKLTGRDVGELLESPRKLGIAIEASTPAALARTKPDVVVHATTSRLQDVFVQVAPVLEAGVDVVSTCEELSFPWKRHPDLSKKIDELARKHGATIVGT